LQQLACRTVLIEGHYVDRDFVDDHALFYARSLRGYPNHCQRLHFFRDAFDTDTWLGLIREAGQGRREQTQARLQDGYLGFSVIRPLPGSPIGRTVLRTFGDRAVDGALRSFGGTRDYRSHVAGFELVVNGLAFQQQDQGVSACATTALWSAIHKVAPMEGLPLATPAQITQAASRYFLPEGRALPSAGLTIDQICEGTRACGLAPVVVRSLDIAQTKSHLHWYVTTGFPVVLGLQPLDGRPDGHAVCAVGLKTGPVAPQVDPSLHYLDTSTSVQAVYIHDDRLGPYAVADLEQYTLRPTDFVPGLKAGTVVPVLRIRWPGEPTELETSLLHTLIVPVPSKLRLSIGRMRALGHMVADTLGARVKGLHQRVQMTCQYRQSAEYLRSAFNYALSDTGLTDLLTATVLSRYVGVVHLAGPDGPLAELLVDSTETEANPSVLCCVGREALPETLRPVIGSIARRLGAEALF
jgi:hypothetical protein